MRFCVGLLREPAGFIASRHHVAPAEATTSAMAARIVNFVVILVANCFIFAVPGVILFFMGSAFFPSAVFLKVACRAMAQRRRVSEGSGLPRGCLGVLCLDYFQSFCLG